MRELRDLTRRRKQLVRSAVQEKNRVQKALEEGNVQLGQVLSNVLGKSGRDMIEALLEGRLGAEQIAELARGQARKKRIELSGVQNHRLTDSQKSLLRHSLRHLDFLKAEIARLDREIQKHIRSHGWQSQQKLLLTLPGVDQTTAASLLAELGSDAGAFPSAAQLRGSNKNYGNEISAQVLFSAAAFIITNPDKANDDVAIYTAAVEGSLRAYESILKVKPKARWPFLDDLLEKRSKGELPEYVRQAAAAHCKGPQ